MSHKPNHSGQPLLLAITMASTILAVFLLSRGPAVWAADPVPDQIANRSDDIVAIPISIKMGVEGIALIDRSNQTICIYQYQAHLPAHQRFSLLSARSFKYDVLLEDYNTAEPRPAAVKELLEQSKTTDSASPAAEDSTPDI